MMANECDLETGVSLLSRRGVSTVVRQSDTRNDVGMPIKEFLLVVTETFHHKRHAEWIQHIFPARVVK